MPLSIGNQVKRRSINEVNQHRVMHCRIAVNTNADMRFIYRLPTSYRQLSFAHTNSQRDSCQDQNME